MESNHPTGGLLRPAGFEDRMGHQTPAAPRAMLERTAGRAAPLQAQLPAARMLSARSGKALERRAIRGGSAMANASVKEQVGDLVTRAKRRVGAEQPSAADDDGRVGVVRGALRTFGEGDTDGFLDALKHDVLWEAPSGGHFPGGGEQDGRDAVKSEFIENAGR